jgi:hypothetical protein
VLVINILVAEVAVQLYRSQGVPEFSNDVVLPGGRYVYARWTQRGEIPLGLNWRGTALGLRFWGVPLAEGQYQAEFEGPYPPNFQSALTVGGSDVLPVVCGEVDAPAASITVTKFLVNFTVSSLPVANYSFGEVLKELGSNASVAQTARRVAWAGSRCIGARGGSAALSVSSTQPVLPASVSAKVSNMLWLYTSSSDYASPSARLLEAGDITAEDMRAVDWIFSLPVAMSGRDKCLLTTHVAVQEMGL